MMADSQFEMCRAPEYQKTDHFGLGWKSAAFNIEDRFVMRQKIPHRVDFFDDGLEFLGVLHRAIAFGR